MSTGESQPLVSAIIPTYKDTRWVMEAIASARVQTMGNIEIIVLDDGSPKHIQDQLRRQFANLSDPRIRLILSEKNRGSANIRNIGVRLAKGRYLAFLDGDDLWKPEKIRCQIEELNKTGAGFSCTSYENFAMENDNTSVRQPSKMITYDSLLRENEIGCSTVMIDRSRVPRPRFPEIRMRQDYALWLKLLRQGIRIAPVQKILTRRRLHPTALSANKWKAIRFTWRMFREIEGIGPVRTGWLVACHISNRFIRKN